MRGGGMAKPQMEHVQWHGYALSLGKRQVWVDEEPQMGSVAPEVQAGEEMAAALACSANGSTLGAGGATATSRKEATKQQQHPFCSKSCLRNYASEIHVIPPRGRDSCWGMII